MSLSEYDQRQLTRVRDKIAAFKTGTLSLQNLIHDLSGLGCAMEDKVWSERLDEAAFELELINSDLIYRKRHADAQDNAAIEAILSRLDAFLI